jgi:hypothetical protein
MKGIRFGWLWMAGIAVAGPYAPEAGQSGTTAVSMNDTAIVAWATGYENFLKGPNAGDSGYTAEDTLGPAEGTTFDVLPLGDGGEVTLTFAQPITNGTGADFAVFENAIDSTGNQAFLELAFVEVSSNGTDFFRFPSVSLTASAVGAFDTLDTTDIHNLAGKYIAGFGTPFDLQDLAGTPGLDVNAVTHVKVIDVTGDGSTQDSLGNDIFDPYPTTGTSGFDLDAIGVLNQIPEPSVFILLLPAFTGLGLWRRWR